MIQEDRTALLNLGKVIIAGVAVMLTLVLTSVLIG